MVLLYLIGNLHQTTTSTKRLFRNPRLYLIGNLHQTTTFVSKHYKSHRCILLGIYIKPQLFILFIFFDHGCILLGIYIKPQPSYKKARGPRSCILLGIYIKPQPRALYTLIFLLLQYIFNKKKRSIALRRSGLIPFFTCQRTKILKNFQLLRHLGFGFFYFPPKIFNIAILLIGHTQYAD